jgi:hypothetical protein
MAIVVFYWFFVMYFIVYNGVLSDLEKFSITKRLMMVV